MSLDMFVHEDSTNHYQPVLVTKHEYIYIYDHAWDLESSQDYPQTISTGTSQLPKEDTISGG